MLIFMFIFLSNQQVVISKCVVVIGYRHYSVFNPNALPIWCVYICFQIKLGFGIRLELNKDRNWWKRKDPSHYYTDFEMSIGSHCCPFDKTEISFNCY